MNGKYRNLTEQEIKALPLEMGICFYLAGWNTIINPKTVDEWINEMWAYWGNDEYMDYTSNEIFEERCRTLAKEEYDKLYNFITKYILGLDY